MSRHATPRRIRTRQGNWQILRAARFAQQQAARWAEDIRADERERIAQAFDEKAKAAFRRADEVDRPASQIAGQ